RRGRAPSSTPPTSTRARAPRRCEKNANSGGAWSFLLTDHPATDMPVPIREIAHVSLWKLGTRVPKPGRACPARATSQTADALHGERRAGGRPVAELRGVVLSPAPNVAVFRERARIGGPGDDRRRVLERSTRRLEHRLQVRVRPGVPVAFAATQLAGRVRA